MDVFNACITGVIFPFSPIPSGDCVIIAKMVISSECEKS